MAALLLQQRSRKYLNLEDKLSRKYLIESTKMEQKYLHELSICKVVKGKDQIKILLILH